ncbi:MAG: hypothetical protein ACQGVC_21055 [Myxococcota bacterium]
MSDTPNFAELLGPFIARFEEEARPAFLAALERGAADRYRAWAEASPEHAAGLLACAEREDEIARTAESLYPPDEGARSAIARVLPEARDAYYAVFADLPLREQWRIQASAERQGANAWRLLAADSDDPKARDELARCAALEEESALHLDGLVG